MASFFNPTKLLNPTTTTSALQKATGAADDALLATKIGPGTVKALKGRGISSTTTLGFSSFFRNSWTKVKDFFKSMFLYLTVPYSRTKMILFTIFIFACIIGIALLVQRFTVQGFTNYTNILSTTKLNTTNRINSLLVNNSIMSDSDDNKLINIQPICFKQTSYIGEKLFDSSQGILDQYRLGSRFFFLQIDYHNSSSLDSDDFGKTYEPRLFLKNNSGDLISKNSSKLTDVFKSLVEFRNNESLPSYNSPIVLLLHFVRLPYNINDVDNYKNYVKKVSDALALHLDTLLVTNYLRASNESDLFNSKFTEFNNKFIIGTNIDTSLYNKSIDLDLKVHFHYYVKEGEIVDVTMPETSSKISTAYIFNANTLLNMSESIRNQWLQIYRNKFIIVKPVNDINLTAANIDTLLNTFNVNIVLHDYFSDNFNNTKAVFDLYNKKSYKIKTTY